MKPYTFSGRLQGWPEEAREGKARILEGE